MNENPLLSLFQKGSPSHLGKTIPFSLTKTGSVFALEKGSIHLFAIEPSGLRHFLTTLHTPLFFGLGELKGLEIEALSDEETPLFELSLEAVTEELLRNEEARRAFGVCLENWIEKLGAVVSKPFPEGKSTEVFPSDSIHISEQGIIACQKELLWIEPLTEGCRLFAETPLEKGKGYFPLFSSLWIDCAAGSAVSAIRTNTLLEKKRWEDSLFLFSSFFLSRIPSLIAFEVEEEKHLLRDRNLEQERSLESAILQMESIFGKSHAYLRKRSYDDLQEACQEISDRSQIQFVFPHTVLFREEIEEKLGIICEASDLGKRRVKLREDWWRQNGGHLLGFWGKEKKPVALIHSSSGKYTLITAGKEMAVDKTLALEIFERAYMFYPSLPPDAASKGSILRFMLENHVSLLISLFLFSLGASLIGFFPSFATQWLFHFAIPERDPSLVAYLFAGLIFSAIGITFFTFLRNYCTLKFEGLGISLVEPAIWNHILKLSPPFFRRFSVGNLFFRISAIEEIRALVSGNLSSLSIAAIFSLFFVLLMSLFAPLLTGIALLVALIHFGITFVFARMKIKILRRSLEIQGKLRGVVIQMISGLGKLRIAGAERSAFSYWASLYSSYKFLQMKAQNIQNHVLSLSAFAPLFSTWAIYAILIEYIGPEKLSLPNFLAFNVAYISFTTSIYPFSNILMQLANIIPAWERTAVILQEPPEEGHGKSDPGKLKGALLIDSVVFGYDKSLPPILKQVTIDIKPHEMIGIVGPSGSGKSTLLRLILGFEKPQSGGIYFDGKDLATLDIRAVRRQIGTVLQGTGILAGSIYENLISGGEYTPEQVDKALELSGFQEDIDSFPMGLMTFIPMNGETLSGGQKQRLLLARALLINPSLIIFDEATSALDNRSQEAITQNLDSLNVTRIIVAQRLSTVRKANRIFVMKNGSVVQKGSFEELSQAPGLFSEMLTRQKL